jgi:very-long-chain (3R)-3-hydroxyacyl-CoA dehydratase
LYAEVYTHYCLHKRYLLCHTAVPEVYKAVELPLKITQTAAVMEVVHCAVGLVRSPLFITGMAFAV